MLSHNLANNLHETQVRVLRHVELLGHVDDLLHPRCLHLPDGRSPREVSPVPGSVLLRLERPSSLLEAAGALTD